MTDGNAMQEENLSADSLKNSQACESFAAGLKELGIVLSDRQMDQFLEFYLLMYEKNKVMNLTAITEFDQVIQKHFLDSLLIARHVDMGKISNVLDMGTGAGFPGIPLKIVYPDIHFTLTDSLNKRILFLNDVIEKCGLRNIEAVHSRAEDLGSNKKYREVYDLVVSRAVANLSTLSEYCIPFVKPGGMFVSYKSAAVDEEYRAAEHAIQILGGQSAGPVHDRIPGTDLDRSFVVIRKVKNTPKRYPRKAGLPGKEPIQ